MSAMHPFCSGRKSAPPRYTWFLALQDLFLLSPASALTVVPYADSSELSYTITICFTLKTPKTIAINIFDRPDIAGFLHCSTPPLYMTPWMPSTLVCDKLHYHSDGATQPLCSGRKLGPQRLIGHWPCKVFFYWVRPAHFLKKIYITHSLTNRKRWGPESLRECSPPYGPGTFTEFPPLPLINFAPIRGPPSALPHPSLNCANFIDHYINFS